MANINNSLNNNDTNMQQSNSGNEGNSATNNQVIASSHSSTGVLQPTALVEGATDMQESGVNENRNQEIDEFMDISNTDMRAFPRTIFNIVTTGESYPWHPNSVFHYSSGSARDERAAGHVAHPSDGGIFFVITFTFSTTSEEYVPPRGDNIGVQDTQPHDMPLPIGSNNTDRSLIVHNAMTERPNEVIPQRPVSDSFTANNGEDNLTNNVGARARASQNIPEQYIPTISSEGSTVVENNDPSAESVRQSTEYSTCQTGACFRKQ